MYVTSTVPSKDKKKTRKRKSDDNEELDTKTFKMSDLISWRPREENQLRKKWEEKEKERREKEANDVTNVQQPSTSDSKSDVPAPQVKLNEKGEIVVDDESLVITERPEENTWTTVHEGFIPKKLNSMSFKKNPVMRSTGWTIEETDLFYYILSATGSDFGLMHDFIPTRTRDELKKKFKKEERTNIARINETLRKPAMLDDKLRVRAKEMLERIREEKLELLERKKSGDRTSVDLQETPATLQIDAHPVSKNGVVNDVVESDIENESKSIVVD